MPTLVSESTRRARKHYQCGLCGIGIMAGEYYHVQTNVYDGRIYDFRTCYECEMHSITNEVYFWAGHPDEGVDIELAWEWAHEYQNADSELGHKARRWLERSNCTCERCEEWFI